MKYAIRVCQTRAAAMAAATRGRKTRFKSAFETRLGIRLAELDEEIEEFLFQHRKEIRGGGRVR